MMDTERTSKVVESKTETGIPVTLYVSGTDIYAAFSHPKIGSQISRSTWGTYNGKEGLQTLVHYKNKIIHVCLLIPKSDWAIMSAEQTRLIRLYQKIAKEASIKSISFESGCDSADIYNLEYDFPEGMPFSFQFPRIDKDKSRLRKIDLMSIGKKLNAEKIASSIRSWGGYRFQGAKLQKVIEILEQKEKQAQKAKAEQKYIEKVKLDKIFLLAKETGKPQKIDSFVTDECLEHLEDCSFDIVTKWANPDGTTKTDFSHCY